MKIPADVPPQMTQSYSHNYNKITHGSGRLMLFAGDQKVEHMNNDFFGENITPENNTPEHMFQIASRAKIGAFATQLGLISQYGNDYSGVPYLVKLNSKTNLVPVSQAESKSYQWHSIDQVMEFKENSGLNILGVGYTIYVGSENETYMYQEAAQLIYEAHQYGLVTVLWMYPRGKAIEQEKDPHIIAGAAGVGACLGADFVTVNYPDVNEGENKAEKLKEAVLAAGRTKIICAGGSTTGPEQFLQDLHDQIHIAGAFGNATGRNIHQRPLEEAIRFCDATYAVTVEDKSVEEAMQIIAAQA
jgi:fructose-bisphosphate aldolase/6-deoxy-5-ketofructose 1-phosphate synthase